MGQVERFFDGMAARLEIAADPVWAEGRGKFLKSEVDTRGLRQAALAPVIQDTAGEVKR